MVGPYKTVDEAVKCILYWQNRALEAERELESELDYERFLLDETTMYQERFYELEDHYEILEGMYHDVIIEAVYYKQQFLDEDKELREALKIVSQMYNKARRANQPKEPEEESDDPWKYRS